MYNVLVGAELSARYADVCLEAKMEGSKIEFLINLSANSHLALSESLLPDIEIAGLGDTSEYSCFATAQAPSDFFGTPSHGAYNGSIRL